MKEGSFQHDLENAVIRCAIHAVAELERPATDDDCGVNDWLRSLNELKSAVHDLLDYMTEETGGESSHSV